MRRAKSRSIEWRSPRNKLGNYRLPSNERTELHSQVSRGTDGVMRTTDLISECNHVLRSAGQRHETHPLRPPAELAQGGAGWERGGKEVIYGGNKSWVCELRSLIWYLTSLMPYRHGAVWSPVKAPRPASPLTAEIPPVPDFNSAFSTSLHRKRPFDIINGTTSRGDCKHCNKYLNRRIHRVLLGSPPLPPPLQRTVRFLKSYWDRIKLFNKSRP